MSINRGTVDSKSTVSEMMKVDSEVTDPNRSKSFIQKGQDSQKPGMIIDTDMDNTSLLDY